MRENMGLYRGKREFNGDWVEGNLIVWPDGTTWIMVYNATEDWLDRFAVDPATVGEYTGLTDKNGKPIFEGDIIDMTGQWWDAAGPAGHDSPICTVEFDPPTGGFEPFSNYDCDCGVFISASGCKVIGNIHDSKEKEEHQ